MDEEREYSDEDVITCSTGVTVKAGDEVTVLITDGIPTVVSSSSSEQSASAAVETASYFWHDEQGAHISEQPESTVGRNILIDQDSVDIKNGDIVLATFQDDSVQFGDTVSFGSYARGTGARVKGHDTVQLIADSSEQIAHTRDTSLFLRATNGLGLSSSLSSAMRLDVNKYENVVLGTHIEEDCTPSYVVSHPKEFRSALDLQLGHYHTPDYADGFTATTLRVYRYGGFYMLDVNALHATSSKTFGTDAVTVGTITNDRYKPPYNVYGIVKMANHYIGRIAVTSSGNITIRYVSNGSQYYSGTGSFYGQVCWAAPAI